MSLIVITIMMVPDGASNDQNIQMTRSNLKNSSCRNYCGKHNKASTPSLFDNGGRGKWGRRVRGGNGGRR